MPLNAMVQSTATPAHRQSVNWRSPGAKSPHSPAAAPAPPLPFPAPIQAPHSHDCAHHTEVQQEEKHEGEHGRVASLQRLRRMKGVHA